MRLYRTEYLDDDTDQQSSVWNGTQSDASKMRKQLKVDGMRNIETSEVDVPTDKKGLLEWLNQNCA